MPLYGDEDIIRARVAAYNAKKNVITEKVVIDGTTYQFERRVFPPDFSMVLPKSFEIMSAENVIKKYHREDRPDIILSNTETTVNIVFTRMAIQSEKLEERLTKYIAWIKKLYPSNVFYTERIFENYPRIACYDYRGFALDTDIYNLSFFTDLPDGELFGGFNCPIDVHENWKPLVWQMIKTLKALPPDHKIAP